METIIELKSSKDKLIFRKQVLTDLPSKELRSIVDQGKKEIKSGDELFVLQNTTHRLEAITEMKILEISFGKFDESDITRLEDDYNR